MIKYFINYQDRSDDVSEASLSISTALNRRSATADFEIFRGQKPTGLETVHIFKGAIIESVSVASGKTTLVLDKTSFDFNGKLFRVGEQVGSIQHAVIGMKPSKILDYDPVLGELEIENANPLLSSGDLIGVLKFGGIVDKVTENNLYTLNNIVYDVSCVGNEQLLNRKIFSDTYENKTTKYLINSIITRNLNYTEIVDIMSYPDDGSLQAEWSSPDPEITDIEVDLIDYIEGESSAVITGTDYGIIERTIPLKDYSRVSSSGNSGFIEFWVKSSDWSNIHGILPVLIDVNGVRIDGSPFVSLWFLLGLENDFFNLFNLNSSSSDWQLIRFPVAFWNDLIFDWSNIVGAELQFVATGAFSVKVNGFRVVANNSIAPRYLNTTTAVNTYTVNRSRASKVLDNIAKSNENTWYVDHWQNLYMSNKLFQQAPYPITQNSANFFDLKTDIDRSQLGTRITVKGGYRSSINAYSQSVQGDGVVREWLMKSQFKGMEVWLDDNTVTGTMEAGTTTTTVVSTAHGLNSGDWITNRTRGESREIAVIDPDTFTVSEIVEQTSGDTFSVFAIPKTVGVENLHDESAYDYMSSFGEKSMRASIQTPTLTPNDYLMFRYYEVRELSVQYSNFSLISKLRNMGLNDGIFDLDDIKDSNIVDTPTAIALAVAKLNDYGNPIIAGSFITDVDGFQVGDLLMVDDPYRGLIGQYVINKISVKQRDGKNLDYLTYNISFGTTLYGAIEFYQKLLDDGDGRLSTESEEAVEIFVSWQDNCEIVEFSDVILYSGNWQYEPSVGQPVPSRFNLASYS